MARTALVLVAVLAFAGNTVAQPSIAASIGPGISRIGTLGEADARQDYSVSAEIEQQALSTRLRAFYTLDAGDYTTDGDWRYLAHGAGATYRIDAGTDKRHHLYLGIDGVLRRNGTSWSAANFNGAGAFVNLEWHPATATTMRGGYRADLRRFPTLAAMNQLQHSVFASALVNLASRTTLIAEVSGGAKHYSAVSSATEVLTLPIDPADRSAWRGTGRRAGASGAMLVPVVVPGAPGSNARQLTLMARVAQSLAARTGLSFEVSHRAVAGTVPPALVATPAQFIDDGVYDDAFASSATRREVTLRSVIGSGVGLAASAAWANKNYPSTSAFDEEGAALAGVLRHDRVALARLETTWPLVPTRTGAVAIDLIGSYDYTRHRSTSALYRYSAHAVRFAIGVSY